MVNISHETAAEITARLGSVLRHADIRVLPGTWSFYETAIDQPPKLDGDVLAVVRDIDSWSALRPSIAADDIELFGVFSFHFSSGLDNSGFVGWLATELKIRLGTGVFVVCGSNASRGGIYDYWGCPAALLSDCLDVIDTLASR